MRNRAAEKLVTADGLKLIQSHLQKLEQKRVQVLEDLQRAREQGDLSENAEYDSAREELDRINSELLEIAPMVGDCKVANVPPDTSVARFGARVSLVEIGKKQQKQYTFRIASKIEARLDDKTYSYFGADLPSAVLSKKVGDTVKVRDSRYKILDLSYDSMN